VVDVVEITSREVGRRAVNLREIELPRQPRIHQNKPDLVVVKK
jgi:hypothetical protein